MQQPLFRLPGPTQGELLARSQEIIQRAIADHPPYAVVLMFSGGDDSLTAYHVTKALNVPLTHMMHGVTHTGIKETTEFVRRFGAESGLRYFEADAGEAYEKYVLRKGFFGIGNIAHEFAYHKLKHGPFKAAISREIRHKKRNRNVLLVNGARWQESQNRKRMKDNPITVDSSVQSTIWVNVINDWSKVDCLDFIEGEPRNPVTDLLHRSAECLCGSMQFPYTETRKEASFWFPEWGRWIDDLEQRACSRGFCWGWGEDLPDKVKAEKKRGKLQHPDQPELPMCQGCQFRATPLT